MFGIEAGVETRRVAVAQLRLVVVLGNAGQGVVAETLVVAVVEVAEGVGLAQLELTAAAAVPQRAEQAQFHALVHGGAGVGFGDDSVAGGSLGLGLYRKQLVANFRAIERQVPLAEPGFTAPADFQGGGGLITQLHAFALQPRGCPTARAKVFVRAPDHRPRVRWLYRAAQVAVNLQLRGEVVTQANARRVVPIMLTERRLAVGVSDLGFAARIDGGKAGGQPQILHQFQLVAYMQHGIGAQVAVVAGLGAGGINGSIARRDAHVFRRAIVRHRLGSTQAESGGAGMAEQAVLADVIQGAADIGVGNFEAVGAFAQVHGVIVIGQPDLDPSVIVQPQGGLVGNPGGARLQAL